MSQITTPYVDEHASAENAEGKTPGYNPSADDKKTIQMVDSMYGRAKKYRKRYDSRWIDYYKMFRGRQWKEIRPSYRSSEVVNLIFEAIQSTVPILVDSKPKLEFLPTIPSQYELADILTKVAANDWEHNNWLMVLLEQIYDAGFYGGSPNYVGFDAEANQGLGSIVYESVDPFYFFPDPQAREINGRRTRHIIHAEPTDISEIKREYKDNPDVKYVMADIMDLAQGDKADIYQVMFKSPTDSKLMVEGPSGYDLIAKNQCLKITLWLKDDETEEEEKATYNDDGTPKLDENQRPISSFIQKLKYPNGRKVVIAGGVLLCDESKEFDDDMFPYSFLRNYMLPREFWGVGDVENLDGPQKVYNKIYCFVLDTLALMGNPIWVVDDTANIDTDNIFNKPGLVVEKTAGSEVRREAGVEIPSFVLPLLDRVRKIFDGVSGVTDLSKGVEPGNITAASAIEDLQDAQQTRLRLKSKHIDAMLQDFGKLYLSRVFQYYSVPRIVRVSGNPKAEEFFYFHVEKLEGGKKQAVITGHDGTIQKTIAIDGEFDVRVATGSSLPFAKKAEGDRAMELFKLGIIDDEEVLKDMDYPNYEMVLQRVQQKKAATQQQQMEMAMAMQKAKIGETDAKANKMHVEAAVLEHAAGTTPQQMGQGQQPPQGA